jgi:aromatic ring hydroxylase
MSDTKRRKTVSVAFDDTGASASLSLYDAPAAPNGAQSVASTVAIGRDDIHPSLHNTFALRGVISAFANIYNRLDNPSADDLTREWNKFIGSVTNGSWKPGRTLSDTAPDDLQLALAEVTGQPVETIIDRLDAMLAAPRLDTNGQPMHDKRDRIMHIHTKAKLYVALENSDPRVKTALSRLATERAKRLAAEARASKTSTTLASMLGVVEAAN